MGILSFLRRKAPEVETRSSGSGFTAEILSARESYISGSRGIAELTGTAQACVSLWEGALSLADVRGAPMLERHVMAGLARSLALRGEFVGLITDRGLVAASDWELRTRDARPTAYRLSIPEAGGGRNVTVLAAEVLHVRIGADPVAPWLGTAPLRRASLSAGLLHAVESALAEVYELAPLGSQVIPFPETAGADMATLGREFRGRRGRVLLRESVNVGAAGGPAPATDWKPQDTTPDLARALPIEALHAARESVALAFGVLPALLHRSTTGPLVREAQRHLATWTLQPIVELVAAEATEKLGTEVEIDVHRPLQSFDAGGSARALSAIIGAMAQAKEAGLSDAQVAAAFGALDWSEAQPKG
jgi:hypothetical protein